MDFDLTQWKKQLGENLRNWKPRMALAGVTSAYAFVSAAALWPVVEAARAGDWSALVALGAVTASVGTNLLANQIQNWKDESDAARHLSETASDARLRAELDEVLEKLGAVTLAREALAEADRQWFTETLRAELLRLGNWERYRATVSGTRNVTIVGSNISAQVTQVEHQNVHHHYAPDLLAAARAEADDARRRYLINLRRFCGVLPLAAMGGEEGAEDEITLDTVYIDLDTETRVPLKEEEQGKRRQHRLPILEREQDSRALTALEAAAQSPRLALLGDPGSGKSTFARHLLGRLAAAQLGEGSPPPGIPASLVPLLITLRDLAPRLAGMKLEALGSDRAWGALVAAVRDQALDDLRLLEAEAFAEGLRAALDSGACLLVLDGLDEVPHDLREAVRRAAGAALSAYRLQRVIVTCRVRSYANDFPNFQRLTLAPFDPDKVRRFAAAWYNAQKALGRFDREQAGARAADFAGAALSADLRELSSNPMMLTTMAIIHQRDIGLPSERVRLYSLAVDVLLRRWQKGKAGALSDFLRDDLRLRAAMERLAYEAQRVGRARREAADLPRGEALALLEAPEYLSSPALAAEFLDYVDQRAGLLVGRGGEPGRPAAYSFPHRTFQEYLAGCHLAGQRDALRAYYAHAAEGQDWSLPAELGAEELHYNRRSTNPLLDLAYRLCPATEPKAEQDERAVLWSAKMAVLVGRETVERDTLPDGGTGYLERLGLGLVGLLGGRLSPPERADAGRALGRLGDPRPEAMTIAGMQFCYVPPGPFMMGSDKAQDAEAHDDELPQHEVILPGYFIARHPVTNAQFGAFIQGGGYGKQRFWLEAEAAGFWRDGRFRGLYDVSFRVAPIDFGDPFGLPNQPVVGVSWYEALAFCRWLTDIPCEEQRLPKGWTVQLPSEAEWEKAARGGLEIPARPSIAAARTRLDPTWLGGEWRSNPDAARIYPWPGKFSANKANVDESGGRTTSALGCFPEGESPYRVLDMSGNVREWTRSILGKDYPSDPKSKAGEELTVPDAVGRMVRGGSYVDDHWFARCASRYWSYPGYRSSIIGFRVVASPFQL